MQENDEWRLAAVISVMVVGSIGFSAVRAADVVALESSGEVVQATGARLVDEWFSDLPWHQKLSTLHSNLIDIPFVLPHAAISSDFCPRDATPTAKARCMLRYGIVNVMAMHRTDTLYQPGEAPEGQDCERDDCVEMRFEFQRLHTQTDDPRGHAPDIVTNDTHQEIPSLGFAITEATIFAPWRPWYMGHYCAVDRDNVSDSVCYEDYFTTQLQAVTNLAANQAWLRDRPALFTPQRKEDGQFGIFCQTGATVCPMLIGKVDWRPGASEPIVVDCLGDPLAVCQTEVAAKTADLDRQLNESITAFVDQGRYPWMEVEIADLAVDIPWMPFIGFYELRKELDSTTGSWFQANPYVLPKACTPEDFTAARRGDLAAVARLADCAVDFEVHTNGFFEQWRHLFGGRLDDAAINEIKQVFPSLAANQYGRTMFMFAGLPEQKIAASFAPGEDGGLSVYDQMYGGSLYTQYLPMVNPADLTLKSKYYQNEFWHAFFMSNHMNQTPDHFIRGIRGRTLWHNEYRSNLMYQAVVQNKVSGTRFEGVLDHVDFPAGFQPENHRAPFHGNTCDSCHVRNGSGIPLMPNGQLSQWHVDRGMKAAFALDPPPKYDYTYTNQHLPAMKMVLFDPRDGATGREQCDVDDHTAPKVIDYRGDRIYGNKIMNFFGNSLHVSLTGGEPTYQMEYVDIGGNYGYEVVADDQPRRPADDPEGDYLPKRVKITEVRIGDARCDRLLDKPAWVNPGVWPMSCGEVSGTSVQAAIDQGEIGFMHLLGKRLGNTPLIEMMPVGAVRDARRAQLDPRTGIGQPGCFGLAPGTRAGENGQDNYRSCRTQRLGDGSQDCYLSRWGWIGDRASLEDQVANAAHVEMNITTTQGFDRVHPDAQRASERVRYRDTLCGPADLSCKERSSNSDLLEQEVRDMATYQRWIGIPQRSEYQVSSAKVRRGERIFRELKCSSCHVIDKIPFIEQDNMLPDEERAALVALSIDSGNQTDYPFISYLGTDLLLHDMGYLSQVAKAPDGVTLRQSNGRIKPQYASYFQRIRTPPLKGLRFNRFVTDSNHNSIRPISKDRPAEDTIPGCDFLLHDGRACDAIEAAYLHDGPAVKAIDMIGSLNRLSVDELRDLRAFLYSL